MQFRRIVFEWPDVFQLVRLDDIPQPARINNQGIRESKMVHHQGRRIDEEKRGMVAPELLFLKISGKFGILPEMIV